jgi:hypothetical protein
MLKKNLILLLVCSLLITFNDSCKKYYSSDSDNDELSGDSSGSEEADDYIWDSSKIINITLNGTTITADNLGVNISGGVATVTNAGTYKISGMMTNGQLIVDTKDSGIVRLILNNVNITCTGSAPVYIKKAAKVLIVLPDESNNFLTDGSTYTLNSDNEPNAAVFSKSYLSFFGNGSLTVKANYKDGIASKDGLVIKSGSINVTSEDDGIRGKDYLILRRGNITINSKGDGLKSDNEDDASLGFISVDSAVLKITSSTGDGINASTKIKISDGFISATTGGGAGTSTGTGGFGSSGGYNGATSEKAIKAEESVIIEKGTIIINSADDAIHSNGSVLINEGTFSIAAGDDAIHAETSITINGGNISISKSYEGIESALITVTNGTINLISSDDAFNATKGLTAGGGESNDGSLLIINGGNVTVNTTNGDGIDSNGNVNITGGTIIVHGPQSQPEVGFDVNGTFSVTGGFLIGTGPNSGNMIQSPATSSSQNSIKTTITATLSSSTLFHIQDSDGNDLITFKPVRSVYYLVFSSPDLKTGSTYSIFTGGTSTGINFNGLFSGGSYSGGTLKKTFTISGKLTNISF